jgi:4-amino-4-deoxy-L-arabinose transferase-like glycosyltransferase
MPIRNRRSLTNATFLWNLVFALTMLVYAAGLFIPIMEPDAAVYAQVSMEMHDRADYLSIYHKGIDWLDKPHFPFWATALSFQIFGVNTLAYKLPAVIFVLLAAFYTYLFAKKYYSRLHGWLAVLILITAEHIIISNHDVRAEPFMTGLMIMGLYHLSSLVQQGGYRRSNERTNETTIPNIRNRFVHITLGSLACACLMMTKGLFTIIPVAAGLGLSLLYNRRWNQILHWQWLAVIATTALFLSPAIYGYYQQFDRHPDKIVFGQRNVSGVEFFLWTSQWGRFTNTGPIKGKGDLTFFIHTMLWAFLPWAFAAFFALYHKIKQLVKGITIGENFTFFGFITLFLIFSASSFQLSFYLNPIFPFLSILTTAILLQQTRRTWRTFSMIHSVLSLLLVAGMIALHYFFSATLPHADTLIIVLAALIMGLIVFRKSGAYIKKTLFATALVVLGVNYYLNREFYPALLKYQAESEAAYFMRERNIPAKELVFADEMESVADVILHHTIRVIPVDSIVHDNVAGKYVFTTEEGKARIGAVGLKFDVVREFQDFPVTRLTGKFINRKTRAQETKTKYLLKVGMLDISKPRVYISAR